MKSLFVSVLFLLASLPAFAQKTVTVTPSITAGDGQLVTDISWSTNPPLTTGTPCVAGSTPTVASWNGAKAGSGSVTGLVMVQNTRLTLDCTFAGDSIATFTWVPTTQNTNGTTYADPKNVVIKYTFNATISNGPTAAAGETVVTVADPIAARPTMRTVTGITQLGTLRALAFHQNANDAFSVASNAATKVFTGNVVVQQGVDLTVRSVPGALTQFSIN